MYLILSLLCLSVALAQDLPPQNPVIGIYTQSYYSETSSPHSYIAASYVKFIQMSGAQVVPIFSFSDTDKVIAQL